jgi:hypothetical protein
MLILPLKKCKYAEVPQMVDTLGVVCFNQGWKKPDFFPLENQVFGFNE